MGNYVSPQQNRFLEKFPQFWSHDGTDFFALVYRVSHCNSIFSQPFSSLSKCNSTLSHWNSLLSLCNSTLSQPFSSVKFWGVTFFIIGILEIPKAATLTARVYANYTTEEDYARRRLFTQFAAISRAYQAFPICDFDLTNKKLFFMLANASAALMLTILYFLFLMAQSIRSQFRALLLCK